MDIQEIRKALKVPDGIRIAQHIYNNMSGYETKASFKIFRDGKFIEEEHQGIDIFYIDDEEFVNEFGEC